MNMLYFENNNKKIPKFLNDKKGRKKKTTKKKQIIHVSAFARCIKLLMVKGVKLDTSKCNPCSALTSQTDQLDHIFDTYMF